MADEKVGYGRPPRQSRFRPGVSGNPKGRPKRKPAPIVDIVREVLEAPATYNERGRAKMTTRYELRLRMLVDRAAQGNVGAADQLLRARNDARRHGDVGVETIRINDMLPTHMTMPDAARRKGPRE
jgi:hypothetical protein